MIRRAIDTFLAGNPDLPPLAAAVRERLTAKGMGGEVAPTLAGLVLGLPGSALRAQEAPFPSRPIRVVPFGTAGGPIDTGHYLAEERPQVVLSDIEMPRMDGFDLARNIRADARLRDLPVIMITSRIAQKHRDYAAELGVDHYLGKPYAEDQLLDLVHRYAGIPTPV